VSEKAARRLKGFARLAVTLLAAWLIYVHIDWAVLLRLLLRADPVRLALAAVVLSVQFVIMAWRWHLVIELLGGPAVGFGPLAIALGRGMLIGQPLPSTVGGDVVRTLALSRRLGLTLAARSVICDRILALAILLALVVVSLPFFAWFVETRSAFLAVSAVSVGGLAAFLVFLAQPRWLAALPRIGAYGTTITADVLQVFTSGMRGQLVVVLALASHLFGVLLIHELAYAVAAPIPLMSCLLIVPPALLISSVPVSLAGWGVREGALAAGFVLVGSSSEAGVATSILFGLTGPLSGLLTELATPFVRPHEIRAKDAA
jgi:glycosyltransferase 2 family protein